MSTRDFEQIQMVRRLMKAGRYLEARALLRDMRSTQVSKLEYQLELLIAANTPPPAPRRLFTRFGMKIGLLIGGAMSLVNLQAGITNIPFLAVCFVVCFAFGAVLPEHERRREATRESVRSRIRKRHHDYLKRSR